MPKRILITPLDWGFGHATRCIPIIRQILQMGHDIHIGGSGSSLALLQEEFSGCSFVELPAYNPKYSRKNGMVWKMGLQLPKFISVIRCEHVRVSTYIKDNQIDLIISDNRFGCWSETITSVFITHQSNILMPRRFGWLSRWVTSATESLIRKFDICWIPDYAAEGGLAGELISFGKLNYAGHLRQIGVLSRLKPVGSVNVQNDILAICSGPEPQRTLLETILTRQLQSSGKKFLLVRGVIARGESGNIVNYLTTGQMQRAIAESEIIISRSGYSTIMDLSVMGKRAIFIPTPGQTEQEYLANRMKEKKIAFCMEQATFDLEIALVESRKYEGFKVMEQSDLLTPALQHALEWNKKTT
jgi:uncharacterized protein (TIGR00661 family)